MLKSSEISKRNLDLVSKEIQAKRLLKKECRVTKMQKRRKTWGQHVLSEVMDYKQAAAAVLSKKQTLKKRADNIM